MTRRSQGGRNWNGSGAADPIVGKLCGERGAPGSAQVQEQRGRHRQRHGKQRGAAAGRAQAAAGRAVARDRIFRRLLFARLAEALGKERCFRHPSRQQHGGERPETPHGMMLGGKRSRGTSGPPHCPTPGRTNSLLTSGRFPFTLWACPNAGREVSSPWIRCPASNQGFFRNQGGSGSQEEVPCSPRWCKEVVRR